MLLQGGTAVAKTESPGELLAKREIEIEQVETLDSSNELADKYYCRCYFCEKELVIGSNHAAAYEKMVKSKNFHCANCIRNEFHTKKRKDILVLTFRAIFGYIYYREYVKATSYSDRNVYLSEIQDFIDAHVKVGLLNPALSYDPDNYLWFVDFSKIGKGKRQIPVEDLYKTVVNILSCFNLYDSAPSVVMHKLYDKYNEAINVFYEKRQRPEGKRFLIPTLSGCGGTAETSFSYEKTRNFLPQYLQIR